MKPSTINSLNENICSVKPPSSDVLTNDNTSMIHHKDPLFITTTIYKNNNKIVSKPYGVSSSHKVLTKGLLLKKWDLVVRCLKETCELTPAERDVTLELLRLHAYYPQVYPKASHVASEVNRGVATFWRTVSKLRDMNLIGVYQRYLLRVEAQISNLYLLDKLIIRIARYLAEHGVGFWEKWLKPYLSMPGHQFWNNIWIRPSILTTVRASPP